MALDILEHGKHPVLCYGSEYGGTAEAHFLALVFGLVGASTASFRVAMGLLTVLIVLAVWAVARVALGERAALLAGIYLACGPAYFFYKCLTSDGGYATLLLSSSLASLALVLAVFRLAAGRSPVALLAACGFLAGLAWWTLPLALGLIASCGLALLLWLASSRARSSAAPARVPWRQLALGVVAATASAALGAAPWIYHNARLEWVSLRAREMDVANARELLTHLRELFRFGWAITLGGWPVWKSLPPWPAVVLTTGLLAVVVGFGIRRLWLERDASRRFALTLFLALVLVPALLSLLSRRTDFREPRYLLLCYLGFAPLCGLLLDAWWGLKTRRAALLGTLAVLGPLSQWTADPLEHWEMAEFHHDLGELDRQLGRLGVHELYASYWLAYRLAFVAHDRLSVSPFGNATNGYVRHQTLAARVDAAPDPGFLLCCDDRRALESYLAARPVRHVSADLGAFRLYRDFPPEFVARLRENRSIPIWLDPTDLAWRAPIGPAVLQRGGTGEYQVVVKNRSEQHIPGNVHLSYHWERLDGTVVLFDGFRTDLPPQHSEDEGVIDITAKVLANVPAGRYRLRFDLVLEGWSWFNEFGTSTPTVDVQVVDATL
jgi:hypothetical protein